MSIQRRILLPLIQTALAIVLTISNHTRPFSVERPTWTAPDKQFCDGVNAPAALLRFLVVRVIDSLFPQYYSVEVVLETVIFLVLIGLLWYAVAIEFEGNGNSVLTPRMRMRRTADAAMMLFGTLLGVVGLIVRGQFGAITIYSNIVAIPYYLWALAIIGFYGHDLWASWNQNTKLMASSRPN